MVRTAPWAKAATGRVVWVAVLVVPIAAWLMLQPSTPSVSRAFALTLALVAIVAELIVAGPDPREGRLEITPIYVAALAWFWSPSVAFGIGTAAVLGGVALRRGNWHSASVKLAASTAGYAVAASVVILLSRSAAGLAAGVGLFSFFVAQSLTRSLTRLALRQVPGVRVPRTPLHPDVLVARGGAYLLLGALVVVLAGDGLTWLLPFTLVPAIALRIGLMRRRKVSESYYGTITALTMMLERAHPDTHSHLDRVSRTAELVAQRLGLSEQRAQLVRAAAILHDIGKIAVDESVLDKAGPLTPAERAHVENHAVWGAQILSPVQRFEQLIPWIRHHHERPDGTGYPDRLPDRAIPIESKIIAVVDAFDAMTCSDRLYRKPISQADAISELERCCATQFDAAVVQAFADVLAEEPA